MNELAVECMDEYTKNKHPAGTKDAEIWNANALAAKDLARARASLDKEPSFPQVKEVNLGVRVFKRLNALYEKANPQNAKRDVCALAWALNLNGWKYHQRYAGQ
jgi:hypothetical protein